MHKRGLCHGAVASSELDMGLVHPWVGLGWVTKFSVLGWSGWVGFSVKNIQCPTKLVHQTHGNNFVNS